ncbi:hypothetical protein PF008_g28549 [Phytophthora fragariae]|uniref:Uncharacterized protein n=1 Tax=Phytophthora fragariae TaxID=53985 RepID=A0A6G0QB06_9STRA|nr:hypothetical protein PF008_g28549 [Phytophthora fragariae]
MVRVPGSLGDSGFHRESAEDVQVKKEPGEEASSERGSTKTLLNETRSADRHISGRNSVDGIEGDLETDLEDKPQYLPQVPSGTPAGLDASRNPLTKTTKAGSDRYTFAGKSIKLETEADRQLLLEVFAKRSRKLMPQKHPSTLVPSWDSSKETTVPRQKMKAPDLEDEEEKGSEPRWSEAALEFAYNRQELQKFIDRDPVLQILRPRQIGTPKGPVAAPTASEGSSARTSEVQIEEAEDCSYRSNRIRDSNRRIDRQTGVILPSRDEQVPDGTATSISQKDNSSGDS